MYLTSYMASYLSYKIKKITQIISAINSNDEDEGATSPSPIACRSRSSALSKATPTPTLNLNLPCVTDAPTDDGDRPFTFDEIKSSLKF